MVGVDDFSDAFRDVWLHGFGPVCGAYEETRDAIIRYMREPVMEEGYRRRVDGFFHWPAPGESRCQAIVDAILELRDDPLLQAGPSGPGR